MFLLTGTLDVQTKKQRGQACTAWLQNSGVPVFLRSVAVNHQIPWCTKFDLNMLSDILKLILRTRRSWAKIIHSKCMLSSTSWWQGEKKQQDTAHGKAEQNTLPQLARWGKTFCVNSSNGCFMRGEGGGAVHFTSFGWAKCKYQWEIFSSNCSWREEKWSAGGLFI